MNKKKCNDKYCQHKFLTQCSAYNTFFVVIPCMANAVVISRRNCVRYCVVSQFFFLGIFDFFVFLGSTPDEVVQQYTDVVGKPFLPPTWSLGFHLCRYGYNTSAFTMEILERMREASIPQAWCGVLICFKNCSFMDVLAV